MIRSSIFRVPNTPGEENCSKYNVIQLFILQLLATFGSNLESETPLLNTVTPNLTVNVLLDATTDEVIGKVMIRYKTSFLRDRNLAFPHAPPGVDLLTTLVG